MALSGWEIDRECGEKAKELFHTLGTSKVQHKLTAMIMVSVLEKNIEVLVDETLKTKVSQSELDKLVVIMQGHFKKGEMTLGLTASIHSLEQKILSSFGGKASGASADELSNTIHFL